VLLTTVRLSSSPCLVRWLALAFVRQGRVAAWWLAFAFVMQGMSAILLQASWFDQVWHHATVGQRPVPISLISRGGSRPVVSDLGMFLRCLNGLPLRCSVKLPIPCPSVQRPNPDPAKHPPPPPTRLLARIGVARHQFDQVLGVQCCTCRRLPAQGDVGTGLVTPRVKGALMITTTTATATTIMIVIISLTIIIIISITMIVITLLRRLQLRLHWRLRLRPLLSS
jgi:hypothetical protein